MRKRRTKAKISKLAVNDDAKRFLHLVRMGKRKEKELQQMDESFKKDSMYSESTEEFFYMTQGL